MMRTRLLSAVLVLALCLASGCAAWRQQTSPAMQQEGDAISVALYTDVTNIGYLEETLQDAWAARHADVKLEFVAWNCYEEPVPKQADLLMYDSMYETYLAENGYIQPIGSAEIEDKEGLLEWTLRDSLYDGEHYGIPMICCTSFLIYHADDAELAQAATIGEVPGDLWTPLLEMIPCYCLEAYIDTWGYSALDELPALDKPDPSMVAAIEQLARDCGTERVEASTWARFDGAQQFDAGVGRAFFGFSENLRSMDTVIDALDIKTISLTGAPGTSTYPTDLVSLASHVDAGERALCLELANLMCSTDVAVALGVYEGQPQYMLPARAAAYAELAASYPLYTKLCSLASSPENHVLRAGAGINAWTQQVKEVLTPYARAAAA